MTIVAIRNLDEMLIQRTSYLNEIEFRLGIPFHVFCLPSQSPYV